MIAPAISFLCIFLLISLSSAHGSEKVGVCYGTLGNNLPSPSGSVKLMESLNANRVKIYDANSTILNALRGSTLQVSIMVPNQLLVNISTNQTLADEWVRQNVVPFYPEVKIRYLLVGNEILSWPDKALKLSLLPAMRRIRYSVKTHKLLKVKVGTPFAWDTLESTTPPSSGAFRSDIVGMGEMLRFLNRTKSFFFVDLYPYFYWTGNPTRVKLDYALMTGNVTFTDPGTGLVYTNLLDQMLDAFHFAMKRLGYPDIRLFIAETGWPNGGDITQIGSNIYNAATYNRNIVKKVTANPPVGTPARPGAVIPAILFALYNENLKGGNATERHFGLLYPNGSHVYDIDLAGKTKESAFKALPPATNNEPYKGKIWCVVAEDANKADLAAALTWACGQKNGTCDPIQPGGECYKPDSLIWHASYAFSSYWSQFMSLGGTCYFNGVAVQTAKDPSYGSCKFPSITV